jgi:hypothetical protein
MKSGNLKFLEPSGPLQTCNSTALPLLCFYIWEKPDNGHTDKPKHAAATLYSSEHRKLCNYCAQTQTHQTYSQDQMSGTHDGGYTGERPNTKTSDGHFTWAYCLCSSHSMSCHIPDKRTLHPTQLSDCWGTSKFLPSKNHQRCAQKNVWTWQWRRKMTEMNAWQRALWYETSNASKGRNFVIMLGSVSFLSWVSRGLLLAAEAWNTQGWPVHRSRYSYWYYSNCKMRPSGIKYFYPKCFSS